MREMFTGKVMMERNLIHLMLWGAQIIPASHQQPGPKASQSIDRLSLEVLSLCSLAEIV